jgi:hypothetical protein
VVVTSTVLPPSTTTGSTSLTGSAFTNTSPLLTASTFALSSVFLVSALAFFVILENSSASAGLSACFAAIGFSAILEIVYLTLISE